MVKMVDNSAYFGVASYNMHGFNTGRSGLLELCNNIHAIAVQEHWLHDNNLQLLNSVHSEFAALSISSMSERLCTSVYYGRPYGGVGLLLRKSFSPDVNLMLKVVQADVCPLFCLWIPVLRLTSLAYSFHVTVTVLIIVMNYLIA